MAEEKQKNKSGAGKFFLGAALGALAGAIAGKFVSMKKDNDILVRLIVKKTKGKLTYCSMRNQRTDFPVIACAVSCIGDEWRVSVGARPGRAVLVRDEKNLLGDGINEENAKRFASYVAEQVPTGSNLRGSDVYRTHLIKVLVERSLNELGGM